MKMGVLLVCCFKCKQGMLYCVYTLNADCILSDYRCQYGRSGREINPRTRKDRMEQFSFSQAEGRIRIEAEMLLFEDDGCILIYGGDEPHIGAVAVGGSDLDQKDIAFPGHKETGIVGMFRETILGKGLMRHCVVMCGIHYDDIGPEGIRTVLSLSERMLAEMCLALENRRG